MIPSTPTAPKAICSTSLLRVLQMAMISIVIIAAGCRTASPRTGSSTATPPEAPPEMSPEASPLSSTDPCAMRLHDIAGAFLLYYAQHGDLPPRLEDLQSLPTADTTLAFTCPDSSQRYVYIPTGILLPQRSERIILYDATPAHAGYRWAIRIEEPRPAHPLVARVVALPNAFFLLRPAR